MCTVPVRGLGMNGRACLCVRSSAVRMCTVPGLGLGMAAYSLPGGVYGQKLYWPCALHFHVYTCGTVFGLGSASSVSCMCVCVCTAVGMCSPSVVPLAVSTCMRALYSIRHGGLGGVGSIHACTIAQCVLCLYCLYSVLAWPARVMYLLARVCTRTVLVPSHSVYCACTPCTVIRHGQDGQCMRVLCLYLLYSGTARVPLVQWFSVASTGRVRIGPCFNSYCGCTIAQCILCLCLM